MNPSSEVVSVSIIAGPITLSPTPPGSFGHLVRMGDGATYLQISRAIARQWLPVITQIAGEEGGEYGIQNLRG
jgi:hypothetical protein